MAELPEGITQKEIDRFLKLDLGIKKLQPEHKVLSEKIKSAFTKLGTWVFGEAIIKRTEASSFDKAAFEKKHPVDRFPEYYSLTLDPTLIEPDVKAKFTTKVQRLSVDKVAEV